MKKNKGFSLIEAVIFIVVVGMAAGVLAFMIGYNAQNGVRNETLTIAGALAEGRMEYIQNLSFSGVAGVARATLPSPFSQFDSEIVMEYVTGPSDLDTVVGGPTNYKKVTVNVYSNNLPGNDAQLRCIKVNRT